MSRWTRVDKWVEISCQKWYPWYVLPKGSIYHFNPNPIKTICLILLLSLLFILAIVKLSPPAEGQNYSPIYASGYVTSTSVDHQSPRIAPRRSTVLAVLTSHPYQENIDLGQKIALENGIYGEEWECMYQLIRKESGWNHLATNKTSGAFGLPQSLPANKIDTFGNRYDPAVQLRWYLSYVSTRYGTNCQALSWSARNNWYWNEF